MTNIVLNPGVGGSTLATDTVAGVDTQIVKIGYSLSGVAPTQVSTTNPLPVSIAASVAVTGTFWQATQPISGTVAATQSGTWNIGTITTLPAITGSVTVSNFPATQAVTGTFWQATQPISGTVSISGTPAISGTVTANQGTANATPWNENIAQFGGSAVVTGTGVGGAGIPRVTVSSDSFPATQAVSGTFWQATQPVSGTVSLGAGAAAIGSVTVTGTPAVSLASTTITGSVTVAQATPANLQATVTQLAITKGTQGSTGVTTQDLKDAGRNTRIFMLDAFTAAPVAEAVQTVVQWYGNAAVAGTTQPAVVPAGKVLRLTGYMISYKSLATVGSAVVRVRANTGGLGVLASPLVCSFEAGSGSGATTVAMTGGTTTETGAFPDGIELPAGTGLAFSMAGYGPTGTLTLEGVTRFSVFGFEY